VFTSGEEKRGREGAETKGRGFLWGGDGWDAIPHGRWRTSVGKKKGNGEKRKM